MLYDEHVGEFTAGDPSSQLPNTMSAPGLIPLSTVISDPLAPNVQLKRAARTWKLAQVANCSGGCRVWVSNSDESMSDQILPEADEESLIPDNIPDEIWQTHFRQGEGELNDKRETEFLLTLYKECSGRWPVIYDRWQSHSVYGPRGKSLESIKTKFSKAVSKLLEVDIFGRRKPSTSMDRLHLSRSLKFLPLFSMKYNEKNEYLRRIFLDNEFRRQKVAEASNNADRYMSDLMRMPSMTMKYKKGSRGGQPSTLPTGPHLTSSLVQSVHSEIGLAESNRVKAVLKSLGVNRNDMMRTPQLAKLFAIVEREAHVLIMMRDSLQRKKQELEIIRTSGLNGLGISHRPRTASQQPPVSVNHVAQSVPNPQQKRKR